MFQSFSAKEIPKNARIICDHFVVQRDQVKNENSYVKINNESVFVLNQQHTNRILPLDAIRNKKNKPVDGVITISKSSIGIKTADCIALMLWSSKKPLLVATHAGFKGHLNGIIEKAIDAVKKEEIDVHIHAYISPHIRSCCYDVADAPDDRVERFINKFGEKSVDTRNGGQFINMSDAMQKILKSKGVLSENIHESKQCTSCTKTLPSHYKSTFIEKQKRDTVLLTKARLT